MTEGASSSRAVAVKNDTTANQPWIEKYRPQTLDEVAANKEIVGTIKRLTDENRLPHLLLYGPPGLTCSSVDQELSHSRPRNATFSSRYGEDINCSCNG